MRLPPNVGRGVALLDEHNPDWREHVDSHSLNMSSSCGCVLGQVYGSYDAGLAALGMSEFGSEPSRFGFFTWGRQRWWHLEAAWRKAIG